MELSATRYIVFDDARHIRELRYTPMGKAVLTMKDGTEYEMGAKGKTVADYNQMRLSDWKKIAEETDRILQDKGILANDADVCPELHCLDKVMINKSGVTYYPPGAEAVHIKHDDTDDGKINTTARYETLEKAAKGWESALRNQYRPSGGGGGGGSAPASGGAGAGGPPPPGSSPLPVGAGDPAEVRLAHGATITEAAGLAGVGEDFVRGTMVQAVKDQYSIVRNTKLHGGDNAYVNDKGEILDMEGYINALTSDATINAAVARMRDIPGGKEAGVRSATQRLLVNIATDICQQWLTPEIDETIKAAASWKHKAETDRDVFKDHIVRAVRDGQGQYLGADASNPLTNAELRQAVKESVLSVANVERCVESRLEALLAAEQSSGWFGGVKGLFGRGAHLVLSGAKKAQESRSWVPTYLKDLC